MQLPLLYVYFPQFELLPLYAFLPRFEVLPLAYVSLQRFLPLLLPCVSPQQVVFLLLYVSLRRFVPLPLCASLPLNEPVLPTPVLFSDCINGNRDYHFSARSDMSPHRLCHLPKKP